MERPKRIWLLLALGIVLVAMPGCSDDDDETEVPVDAAVEAELNVVLETTVDPLLQFVGLVAQLAAPAVGGVPEGLVCPFDTSEICVTGSVDCTLDGNVAHLDWQSCSIPDPEGTLVVDGNMDVTLGEGVVDVVLNGVTMNASEEMTGTAVLTAADCSVAVDIEAGNNASFEGTLIQCESDDWPTAESVLLITLDTDAGTFVVDVEFNGTGEVTADVTDGGDKVAECDIDLDSLEANCHD